MSDEKTKIFIQKNKVFKVKDTKVILSEDILVSNSEKGFFILDFWTQCDFEDINIFPVAYAKCERQEDEYELFKTNIVYGGVEDICLI